MRYSSFIKTVFSLCFIFLLFSCADKIPDKSGFKSLGLYAYDSKSSSLRLSEDSSSSYLYYYLSDEDTESGILSNKDKLPQSLELSFSPQSKDAEVIVSFLYPADFNDGKLKETLSVRPLAKCSLPAGKTACVRLALPADRSKVKGFLVYSKDTLAIEDVAKVNTVIGWYKDESSVSWSFGPEGGDEVSLLTAKDADSLSSDFSSSLGLTAITDNSVHEYVKVYFRDEPSDMGGNGNQGFADLTVGKKLFRIFRSYLPQIKKFYVPYFFQANSSRDLKVLSGASMITGMEYEYVLTEAGFSDKGRRIPSAISSDLGCVPGWPSELWGRKEFELFSWDMFPNILLFDFADYDIQDDYLKRLAFYVEKVGYRGKLWTEEDLEGLHGYNAHDYRPESLASFFTVAAVENFPLNESEYFLRDILLHYGIIKKGDDAKSFLPGEGGIISISKESPEYLRHSLLTHESFHGIYFVDEPYRQKVSEVCTIMDNKSLAFLKGYFESQPTLSYDLKDSYLVENEIMAYLMQQSLQAQGSYFAENIARRGSVTKALPDLASYVRDTNASGLAAAAAILDDYVFQRWGLNAGRTYMVSVSQK